MARLTKFVASTGLILLLASCGSGSDGTPASDPTSSAEIKLADPTNPFAAAEKTMSDNMMTAVGADVSDTWLKQIIEHHRGAIAMSQIVLDANPSPNVLAMARQTIAKQGKEVEDLTKLLSKASADPASLEPFKPANLAMHDAMMAAKGADISETYLRKMLVHHRGAIALADAVLANGASGLVRAAAQKVKTEQTKEISMLEAMLAGKPMPTASPDAAPVKSGAATSAPSAASSPKRPVDRPAPAKAAPRPSPSPTATVDPHAGHDMSQMPDPKR